MSDHFLVRALALTLAATGPLAACATVRNVPVIGASAPPASSPARAAMTPRNGLEVIGAMRRAHPSRALRSIAFTVTSTEFGSAAPREAQARALAALPGNFRVTALPATRRTATVRNQQRLAVFERGRRVTSQNRIDLATLLAYDVYAQGIDSTIRWLDVARVRFGVARRARFDGRSTWVVGALDGDTTSAQFWVDASDWRVVRVIQRDPRVPRDLLDIRFLEATDVMGVPLPTRIELFRGGRLAERQVITHVTVNPVIPTNAFDVSRWRDVRLTN